MRAFYCDCGNNWGDNFTRYLLEKKYDLQWEWVEPELEKPVEADVFGLGSILEYVPPEYTGHILGSGFMFADSRRDLTKANVHILRGKRTRERVLVQGEPALGDPALLACDFAPKKVAKEYVHGLIPHYVDRDHPEMFKWSKRDDTLVIDIRSGIKNVIRQAMSCEKIVSTSLHGLVLADSLEIPNCWLQLSDKIHGGEFKFVDYYSVYGEFPWAEHDTQQAFATCRSRDTRFVKAVLRGALEKFVQAVK